MGVFDKLKNLVGIEEIDDDEITEEEIQEAAVKLERKIIDPKQHQSAASKNEINERKVQPAPASRPSVTVSDRTGSFKLVVIEPKGFDECPKLVDNLKSRKPVIVNMEELEIDCAQRILDFMAGAIYALDGTIYKISRGIFVVAPTNYDVIGNDDRTDVDVI